MIYVLRVKVPRLSEHTWKDVQRVDAGVGHEGRQAGHENPGGSVG